MSQKTTTEHIDAAIEELEAARESAKERETRERIQDAIRNLTNTAVKEEGYEYFFKE